MSNKNKATIHTDITKELFTRVLIEAQKATKEDEASRHTEVS